MDHAAVHGHGLREHVFVHADLPQRCDAAIGQSKIDRAAGCDLGLSHVGTCFKNVDGKAAACEIN
jgi:hypothetical protein